MDCSLPKPESFTLQWHITERCNQHCKHCYQDETIKEELTTEQLFEVIKQYSSLIKKWNIPKTSALLSITGGEPFVREDFFQLAEEAGKNSNFYRWGLLSNGSFITKSVVEKLKNFGMSYYQVSLEGLEDNNDCIRGKGSFKKTIETIKILVKEKIPVTASLTLTKQNITDIPGLVKLLDDIGAGILTTRRLVPIGRGSNMERCLLEPLELRQLYMNTKKINETLKKKGSKLKIVTGCESGIFNDEILNSVQKIPQQNCGAVDGRILTVMPDGDVLSCRRLPIAVGNVLKQSLFEIWYSSNRLWRWRNLNNAHPFCQKCPAFNQCFGGAKCVTYAYYNQLFVPDAQCWKHSKKLLSRNFFSDQKIEEKKEVQLAPSLTKTQLPSKENIEKKHETADSENHEEEYIKIDPQSDLDKEISKLCTAKEYKLSFQFKEEDINNSTGMKIMKFLNELNQKNIIFKINKPLPRCLFGLKYGKMAEKFNAPENCLDCEEMFTIEKDIIKSCSIINKKGPKVYYVTGRQQIREYFDTLKTEKEPAERCKKCLYLKRKRCGCFILK